MKSQKQHESPCPYFPICGGCDFLDLDEENYRKLKRENFEQDLHKSKNSTEVEWIWISPHSRRKIIFQIDKKNRLGFFSKKTIDLIEIDECFVAEKEISKLIPSLKKFLKNQEQNFFSQASITLFDNGLDLVLTVQKEPDFLQTKKITDFAKEQNLNISYRFKNQLTPIFLGRKNQIFYPDFKLDLDSEIFIQATKSGLDSIIKIIKSEIGLNESITDLYAGFGAYSFAILDVTKHVTAFEGDQKMVDLINKNAIKNNLSNKIKAEARDLFSIPITKRELKHFDLAIINPPRNGASPQISEISKSSLKRLIYVSCNPQSFWRDAKILIDSGFKITKLFALDQFYGTNHLELISVFKKND